MSGGGRGHEGGSPKTPSMSNLLEIFRSPLAVIPSGEFPYTPVYQLTRMQINTESSSALVGLTPSLALSSPIDVGRTVAGVEGEERTKGELGEEQEAEIASLKKVIAQLQSEKAESGDAMKNLLEAHRREGEEREQASKEMQKKCVISGLGLPCLPIDNKGGPATSWNKRIINGSSKASFTNE